jgi:L-threonylcarbamoyladenylate synthase
MRVRVIRLEASSVLAAAKVVKRGGLVIYPTDTVYGLGCNPRSEEAVERLFVVKQREGKPIPILCDGMDSAKAAVFLSEAAERLAKRFWPGALTIVAPARIELPYPVHQGTGMVGVRVPDHELCLSLIRECGGTLTGTSANLSGRPPCRSAEEALAEFRSSVDLILDGGMLHAIESTVVRLDGERIEVLREGGVRVKDELTHQ